MQGLYSIFQLGQNKILFMGTVSHKLMPPLKFIIDFDNQSNLILVISNKIYICITPSK